MNPLLEFMANKAAEIVASKAKDQISNIATDQLSHIGTGQSMGFGVSMPPMEIDDSVALLQNTMAQAGIQNEAVNNLVPAAPMMPLPQLPQRFMPQPPPMSERERALEEDKKRIEEGRRPRLLE